ncbi:MAG: FAD-dependent oxidoreductase [Hyphomicrobiales bacterium]|nr:FAD-dependent oxidoreductase [Hyphomicrobiales bacterium]
MRSWQWAISATTSFTVADGVPRGKSESGGYDVVVAGGGASGMIAAVAAARNGARVMLIERESCLGGTATSAYVAQYVGFYNHNTQAVWGIPYELTRRIIEAGGSEDFGHYTMAEAAANPLTIHHFPFNPEIVKIVADEMTDEAGIDILLHAQICGVVMDGDTVAGVSVETISGRRDITGKVIIDATGDAIVAHAAGIRMLDEEDADRQSRQPMTLCFRLSNVDVPAFRSLPRDRKRALALKGIQDGELFWESMSFVSTPGGHDAICLMSRIMGLDALNEADLSEAERVGRRQIKSIAAFLKREVPGFEQSILASIAPRVGIRETRRIEGQYMLTGEDILQQRRFEDTVALGCGPMDIHDPHGTGISLHMPPAPFDIPMRTMIPKQADGLIVTGRAICATHEANGGARHMATAMALGQAAGTMAAIAAADDVAVRDLASERVRAALRKDGAALSVDDCGRYAAG